jgi:hypothetical protein
VVVTGAARKVSRKTVSHGVEARKCIYKFKIKPLKNILTVDNRLLKTGDIFL